ncbi:MAG: DoxX family membrane protein [Proteobacteria bacterium]|nr:DoxX family membrane protein [Pseudomonadota bacterium]
MEAAKHSVLRLFREKWAVADVLLRLALAGILLAASAGKIMDPQGFSAVVRDYQILPSALIAPTAVILPWLELVLGILLLAGRMRLGTLLLVNALLLTFLGALIANYFRGIDVACGCFSTTREASSPMLWYIVRDGAFVALALGAAWAYRARLRRGLVD